MNPQSTIIIPAYNEEKYIARLLESLMHQSFRNFEVILVDDGSKDKTLEVAKSFKNKLRLRIFSQNHLGPGAARNLAAKHARGDFLVFLDADMVCHRDSILDLIRPLIKDKTLVGTVHNREEASNLDNRWSRCAGKIRKLNSDLEENAFRAIRKKKFIQAEGFDTSWGYFDDNSLSKKIGKAKVVPALLYHNNPASLQEIYVQEKWKGNSYPNYKLLRNLMFLTGVLLILIFVANFFRISAGNMAQILLLSLVLGFILLCISKSLKERDLTILLILPMYYATKISGRLSGLFKKLIKSNAPQ